MQGNGVEQTFQSLSQQGQRTATHHSLGQSDGQEEIRGAPPTKIMLGTEDNSPFHTCASLGLARGCTVRRGGVWLFLQHFPFSISPPTSQLPSWQMSLTNTAAQGGGQLITQICCTVISRAVFLPQTRNGQQHEEDVLVGKSGFWDLAMIGTIAGAQGIRRTREGQEEWEKSTLLARNCFPGQKYTKEGGNRSLLLFVRAGPGSDDIIQLYYVLKWLGGTLGNLIP